ncbi:serum response factor-binding protein 1 isoform X2 [Protopterus annectens]|nr:serum response factor-binding protein 1 isoform X2 [Protopterus annectens]
MRRDVKKARVLIIRKLTRHISKLKSKKGSEELISKNCKRAERLVEEIHVMKDLKPDIVTKMALQKDISFEKVCKKTDSSAKERAIARIVSHPLLSKKIADLKAAVKTFKEARQTPQKVQKLKEASDQVKDTLQPAHMATGSVDKEGTGTEQAKRKPVMESMSPGSQNKGRKLKDKQISPVQSPVEKVTVLDQSTLANEHDVNSKVAQTTVQKQKQFQKPQQKIRNSDVEFSSSEESIDDDDGEKEYFDDSTEERFYNQSSGSASDSDDDFFVGKMRQTKKKTSQKDARKEKKLLDTVTKVLESTPKETQSLIQTNKEELKNKQKDTKLESVFCSSLSGKQKQHPKSWKRNHPDKLQASKKAAARNISQVKKQEPATFQHGKLVSKVQESLHPSWEASKRRKEQQSKIAEFQGKKIIFDDD